MADYLLELLWDDNAGNTAKLDVIDEYLRLEMSRTINGIGVLKIDLDYDYIRQQNQTRLENAIPLDSRWRVWRRAPGGTWSVLTDTEWFTRYPARVITKSNPQERIIRVTALSATHLLQRRRIAYHAGQSRAKALNTETADDVLKRWVRQNLGSQIASPSGGTATAYDSDTRDLSTLLQVAEDLGLGPSIKKKVHWQPLWQAMQDLCADSEAKGHFLGFDIHSLGESNKLEFRTHYEHRGTDHAPERTTGDPPTNGLVVLGIEFATLLQAEWGLDRTTETNYVYAARRKQNIVYRRDTERVEASYWNRCEGYADASNAEDDTEAKEEADSLLRDGRPIKQFSALLGETESHRFGIDWDFGDRVVATLDGEEEIVTIDSLRLRVQAGGTESIDATLKVESTGTAEDG